MPSRILIALVYGGVFHYAYIAYINPTFEYAGFSYHPPSFLAAAFGYFLAVLPTLAWRPSNAPASYGAALVYVLCYVPAQVMLLVNLDRPPLEIALVQMALAASMTFLMRVSRLGMRSGAQPIPVDGRLSAAIGLLAMASILILVAGHYQHMRFVSFADVYDLRFEASEVQLGTVSEYLVSWLAYCFLPFFFARGVLHKSLRDFAFGMAGVVVIYMATGAKAAILMPAIVIGMSLLARSGPDFLRRLLVAVTIGVVAVTQLIPDEGVFIWAKSILLMRILGTGGWTISVYYDYFDTHGYTYYTHIGPIQALTDAYPYGQYSLGQTIGIHYSGSELANFNANFWASDGFAAWGFLGVAVVTFAVGLFFIALNRIGSGCSPYFLPLWLSGFWLALLNVPFTTALLSGGGGLVLLLVWFAGKRRKVPDAGPDTSLPHGLHLREPA